MYSVSTNIPTSAQDITLYRYACGSEYASFALWRAVSSKQILANRHLRILGS